MSDRQLVRRSLQLPQSQLLKILENWMPKLLNILSNTPIVSYFIPRTCDLKSVIHCMPRSASKLAILFRSSLVAGVAGVALRWRTREQRLRQGSLCEPFISSRSPEVMIRSSLAYSCRRIWRQTPIPSCFAPNLRPPSQSSCILCDGFRCHCKMTAAS